jgi:hypothetical protein
MYWQPCQAKQCLSCTLPHHENEHQPSVNSFKSSKSENYRVIELWLGIMGVMTAIIGEKEKDTEIAQH